MYKSLLRSVSGDITRTKGANSSRGRVVRGGSWITSPRNLRSAYRGRDDVPDDAIGFRVARTLD